MTTAAVARQLEYIRVGQMATGDKVTGTVTEVVKEHGKFKQDMLKMHTVSGNIMFPLTAMLRYKLVDLFGSVEQTKGRLITITKDGEEQSMKHPDTKVYKLSVK